MAVEDNQINRIEIANAFSDGYHIGKRVAYETIFAWLLKHAPSYGMDIQHYDELSLVIDLRDFLNCLVKDGRKRAIHV